jgi:hypothetical protein
MPASSGSRSARSFDLLTANRPDGLVLPASALGTRSMKLQSSDNLSGRTDESTMPNVQIDLSGAKKFLRCQAVVS